jgi:hypothetical protein
MAQLGNTYTGRFADLQKQRLSPHHLYYAYDTKQLYTFFEDGTPYLLAPIFGDGSSVESDPIFVSSPSYDITELQIQQWDTAFSWGDHYEMGYITGIDVQDLNIQPETQTIATISAIDKDGNSLNPVTVKETVTHFNEPIINGTTITFYYVNELGDDEFHTIDLDPMLPDLADDTYVTEFTWSIDDPTNNTAVIVDSNGVEYSLDFSHFLQRNEIVDLNTNTSLHAIAQAGDVTINETITTLDNPTLSGTVLTLRYFDEDGALQEPSVDLADIIPEIENGIHIENFYLTGNTLYIKEYNVATPWEVTLPNMVRISSAGIDPDNPNQLVIVETDGTEWPIPLPPYITVVNYADTNANPTRHKIGDITVEEVTVGVYETVTTLGDPVLSGTVLTIKFNKEDGQEQTVDVDLADIIPQIEQGIHIEDFYIDGNMLYIKELNVATPWSVELPDGLIETQTTLDAPYLNGTVLNITYTGENGVQQNQSIDLADILPEISDGFRIEDFYFDTVNSRPHILAIKEVGVTQPWEIDLTKYILTTTDNGDGTTTVFQDGVAKFTIPKAYTGYRVEDKLGNERFFVNDFIRFEGVTFDPEQNLISVETDPLPDGLEGQVYYIDKDGTNDVEPDFLLHRGIVVENQEEFDIAATTPFSLEEVFLNWDMFSHYWGSYPENQSPPVFPSFNDIEGHHPNQTLTPDEFYGRTAWNYDAANNRIFLSKNYNPTTGFISPQSFGNFTFEATFSSPNGDDDTIALVIGFYTDQDTGYEHSLMVTRQLGDSTTSYGVFYNQGQDPNIAFRVLDGTNLAPFAGGAPNLEAWNNGNKTRVQVVRSGDVFQIKTSQFKSEVIDNSTLLTLNLNDYPQLAGFKTASKIGFSATSQKDAYFSDILFTGFTEYIFWPKREDPTKPNEYTSYETWAYDFDTQQYFLQNPQTIFGEDYFGKGRFVYSYLFGKTYYINEHDQWIKISGDNLSEAEIIEIINSGEAFNQNNFVRRLNIDPSLLTTQDIDGVLNYLNTIQGFSIDETEVYVIETGDGEGAPQGPTDPPEEPQTFQWDITAPANASLHFIGSDLTITTIYEGDGNPTKVEHFIDGVKVATITENLIGSVSSVTYLDSSYEPGNAVITAKLYYGLEVEPFIPSVNIKVRQPFSGNSELQILEPSDGYIFATNEVFNISTLYSGDLNATKIQVIIGPVGEEGFVTHQYTNNLYDTHSFQQSFGVAGDYDITLKLFVDGVENNTVLVPIITITVSENPPPPPPPTTTYFPITRHRAGSYKVGNSIDIQARSSYSGDTLLERTESDTTVRETEQALPWVPPSAYLEDDELAVSIPLNEIEQFKVRYNQVKELLVDFSSDLPNVKTIWLRANQINLGTLDLTNCSYLEVLDISDNYISDILLPAASNINFVYVGGLQMSGIPAPKVISDLMAHIVSTGVTNGNFSSSACVADGSVTDHETLVSRGWNVSHITVPLQTPLLPSNAGATDIDTHTMQLICSTYGWAVVSKPSWIVTTGTGMNSSGAKSNSIQNFTFGFEPNNTGLIRDGEIHIKKVKDDGNEYKGRAVITVTQQG